MNSIRYIYLIFIFLFFSNVSLANSSWETWYSNNLFAPNISKDIQTIDENAIIRESIKRSKEIIERVNIKIPTRFN
jgi:hypothetical protein